MNEYTCAYFYGEQLSRPHSTIQTFYLIKSNGYAKINLIIYFYSGNIPFQVQPSKQSSFIQVFSKYFKYCKKSQRFLSIDKKLSYKTENNYNYFSNILIFFMS